MGKEQSRPSRSRDWPSYSRYSGSYGRSSGYTHSNGRSKETVMGNEQNKPWRSRDLPSYSRYSASYGRSSGYTHYNGNTIGYPNSVLIGRQRLAEDFRGNMRITVSKITPPILGRELVKRCGNEGNHPYLDSAGQITLKFFRAAISLIPMALDAGADLTNASFIFAQANRELVITAGKGDWEFYFYHGYDDEIYGHCVRKPMLRYIWDGVKSTVRTLVPLLGPTLLALMAA